MFTTQFKLTPDDIENQDNIFYLKSQSDKPKGTILFIHGFTSTYLLHHWFVLKNDFEDYNYLALNLEGHKFNGDKKEKLKELDLYNFVNQLESYIESHQIYNLTLIGHSMGGGIALLLYERIKKRVNRIILVDAINPAIYKSKIGFRYLFETFYNRLREIKLIEFKNDLKKIEHDDDTGIVSAYINYEIERFLEKKKKFLFLGTKLIDPKLYIHLHKIYKTIDIPVLFLIGKYDRVIPYGATKRYFKKIDNPKIIVKTIADSAHVPFIENFDQYNEYVWWFINKY